MSTVSIAAPAAVAGNRPPFPQTYIFETLADWRASPVYRECLPPFRTRRPWYVEDEDYVARHYPSAMPVSDIAATLRRSIGAIRAKARALGVRRLRIGEEPSAELPPTPSPPAPSARDTFLLDGQLQTLRRTRSGRLIWDNSALLLLIACHLRMFTPALTARILGLTTGQVTTQANRIGLLKRDGFVLVNALPDGNPFDFPKHPVFSAFSDIKKCKKRDTWFCTHVKHTREVTRCPVQRKNDGYDDRSGAYA